MDFFDDVFEKAKNVFDVAKNKTEEAVIIGKQKYDVAAMESRLNKSYNALGRLCYENYKNDAESSDEIKALISEITSETEAIENARAEIAKMKNKRICPKCGETVAEASVFCNRCGERLIYTEE